MPAERPDYAIFYVFSALNGRNSSQEHSLRFCIFAHAFALHLWRHFNTSLGLYRHTEHWVITRVKADQLIARFRIRDFNPVTPLGRLVAGNSPIDDSTWY